MTKIYCGNTKDTCMIRRKTLHSNRSFDILFFNVALLHQKHIYAYSSITCIMTFKAMDWTFLIFNFFIHSFHFQNMTLYNLIGVFSTFADFQLRGLIIKVFVHLRNISKKGLQFEILRIRSWLYIRKCPLKHMVKLSFV